MGDSNALGCLGMIITGVISIGTGILAWNWIEPEGFFGVIIFLLVWGLISYVIYMILGGIIALLSEK